MLIGNLGIGIVGTVQPDINTSNAAGGLLIFSVCVLAVGSVTGPGAAGWTYTGESGSVRLRAKTNTLGNLGNAAMSWVMGSTVSLMLASWSFKVGKWKSRGERKQRQLIKDTMSTSPGETC